MVLLHPRDPFPRVRFGVGVGNLSEPARHLPITGQCDQVNEIIITQWADPEPSGFDLDAGAPAEAAALSIGGGTNLDLSSRAVLLGFDLAQLPRRGARPPPTDRADTKIGESLEL